MAVNARISHEQMPGDAACPDKIALRLKDLGASHKGDANYSEPWAV